MNDDEQVEALIENIAKHLYAAHVFARGYGREDVAAQFAAIHDEAIPELRACVQRLVERELQ